MTDWSTRPPRRHTLTPGQARSARAAIEQLDAKCRTMSATEAAAYLRRHVERMRTHGASVLPSSLCERVADLLEQQS